MLVLGSIGVLAAASSVAGGEYDLWRTHRQTGQSARWADLPGSRNMTTILVDADGLHGDPGDVIIGNARQANDIEIVDADTRTASAMVSSTDLYIPRGLVFAAGTLYCVESTATPGIWAIGAGGQITRVDDGGFSWRMPHALAYRSVEDAFYVGDSILDQIIRLPRTGGAAEVVGTGFGEIAGLALDDAERYLYVSDLAEDVVWEALVPEPATPSLLAFGGLALLRWRRR